MDLYAESILDHYRNPRGKTLQSNEEFSTASNPACGDEISVHTDTKDGVVRKIIWHGTGCAISQAAVSMLVEEFTGKTTQELLAYTKDDMLSLLNVPIGPRRLKCALLGLEALQNACQK